MNRTTPNLQRSVSLLGVLAAIVVLVLVGRAVNGAFDDINDKFNACTTQTSTC